MLINLCWMSAQVLGNGDLSVSPPASGTRSFLEGTVFKQLPGTLNGSDDSTHSALPLAPITAFSRLNAFIAAGKSAWMFARYQHTIAEANGQWTLSYQTATDVANAGSPLAALADALQNADYDADAIYDHDDVSSPPIGSLTWTVKCLGTSTADTGHVLTLTGLDALGGGGH
eukprot:COSAG01_NODE_2007_length_8663_cov_13.801378_2_plen_172_part_00